MRTITTSRGKTYPVDYCGIGYLGMIKLQLQDSRPLGHIAPEMDGLEWLVYTDNDGTIQRFEDFCVLKRAEWVDGHSVVILLDKEAKDGDSEI